MLRVRCALVSMALFSAGFIACSVETSFALSLTQGVAGNLYEALEPNIALVTSNDNKFQVRSGDQSWHSPAVANNSVMNGTDLQNCRYAQIPNDLFVSIFVMTRDRMSSLDKTLKSYWDTIKTPYEIIILDHNSTFPPMKEYLNQLTATRNVSVHQLTHEVWTDALEEANQLIQRYLEQHPRVLFYAYTDPDVAFLRTAPDVLLFYAGLLMSCPEYEVVGPGLQISDIPSQFSKTTSNNESVFQRHSKFWKDVPNMATWNGIGYHIANHPIDTTFGMYRRNTQFKRGTFPSLRAYAPYAAVHVDWYDDSQNLPADKIYYSKRQSGVNNW